MSKARLFMAGTVVSGLVGVGAVMIPSGAAWADTTSTSTTSSTDPLLSVCVTVTPKTVTVDVNGNPIVLGPIAVSTTCVAV